ncbi:MAG: tyrosine-protein kinase [Gaiellales bacterium]|nr:tyrosine-protein kinase [Gaiellales bacterium]
MKPDLTFRRSVRLILQRWWLVLLCGLGFAALAFGVTGFQKGHYTATTKLTITDYTVITDQFTGLPSAVQNNPKFGDSWVTQDFVSTAAAQKAMGLAGTSSCMSPSALVSGLTVTGLTTSTVQLDLVGCSSQSDTANTLDKYAQVLLSQRSLQERSQLAATVNAIGQGQIDIKSVSDRNNTVAKLTKTIGTLIVDSHGNGPSDWHTVPTTAFVKSSAPKGIIALIGGLLAGLAVGSLVALAIGRLDRYVRRVDDVEVAGVPVVDIDSELDPASVQLLRSELELAGVGTKLAVVTVTRAQREEGSSGLALSLARAFAGVGTPTTLVSADLRGSRVRTEAGLSGLLSGAQTTAPLVRLDPNLNWLPEGDSSSLPETLFSAPRVDRILRDLREHVSVIVIDAPAALEDSETLPLVACSDVVLLAVRPGRTRWQALGSAVALIQRIAQRPMHICYDHAGEMTSVPAAGEPRLLPSERVPRAVEVSAGS